MSGAESSEVVVGPPVTGLGPCDDSRQMIVSVSPGGLGEHSGGWSETVAKVLTGPLVWAVFFAFLVVRLRSPLHQLIEALRKRVEAGDDLDVVGVKVTKKVLVDEAGGVRVEEKIVSDGVAME